MNNKLVENFVINTLIESHLQFELIDRYYVEKEDEYSDFVKIFFIFYKNGVKYAVSSAFNLGHDPNYIDKIISNLYEKVFDHLKDEKFYVLYNGSFYFVTTNEMHDHDEMIGCYSKDKAFRTAKQKNNEKRLKGEN